MTVRASANPQRGHWITTGVLGCLALCLVLVMGSVAFYSLWGVGWRTTQDPARATRARTTGLTPVPTEGVLSSTSLPPSVVNLLPVPAVSQGFEEWQLWSQPGSFVAGTNQVKIVADPKYGKVIEFSRTDAGTDGGAAGLILPLVLDVSHHPHLHVRLTGKVIEEQGGNLANSNPQWFPEGAVQVRIKYLTAREEEREWYHGFYSHSVPNADSEHFTQVPLENWFDYVSIDLKSLAEAPYVVTEVRVYGFGWEFQGQVAEVSLVGSAVSLPSTR